METQRSVSSGQHEVGMRQVVEWLTNPSNEDGALWVLRKLHKDHPILWQKAQHAPTEARARSPRLIMPRTREVLRPTSLFSTDEGEDEGFALLDFDWAGTRKAVPDRKSIKSVNKKEFWIESAVSSQSRRTSHSRASFIGSLGLESFSVERRKLPDSITDDSIPILMFNDKVYLSQEEQGAVEIVVLRVGDTSKRSEVRWFTQDASAKAGQTYVAGEGTLVFKPGMTSITIEVMLISNVMWDSILEFKILLDHEGLVNGTLDRYMHETSVKVFNDDPFPTNEYQELLQSGRADEVPPFVLIKAYIATNCRDKDIWTRTVEGMVFDQLHNLVFCAGLFMQVYLIDCALNLKCPEELLFMRCRQATLFLLVSARLIPNLILHLFDYRVVKLSSVVGPSRAMVQSALFRHYFYCLESCRSHLGFTGLLMAMSNDADTVSEDVYRTVSKAPLHIGKLIAICIFQLGAPFVFGTSMKLFPLIVMGAFPVVMGGFLAYRQEFTKTRLNEFRDKHYSFCQAVGQIAENFEMITAFAKQDTAEQSLAEKVNDRNLAANLASLCVFDNQYFSNWLTLVVVCGYTVVGGLNVIDSVTSVGYFVTTMSMFQQMGAIWSEFFHDIVKVQAAVPALIRITNFLNMPSDLEEREEAKRRDKLMQHGEDIDKYPIVLRGFQEYLGRTPGPDCDIIELRQGQMIAVTSPRAGGKTTLLRLLGRVSFPPADSNVHMHVPSHLRVLYVSSIPFFFFGTLENNLAFGMKADDPDRSMERLVTICKSLGLSSYVTELLQDSEANDHWRQVLAASDCHLLNIARALVANPDVLCLEKPTLKIDDVHSEKVLTTLRSFVVQKGLAWSFPEGCRRPRTVMFTTERITAVDHSDVTIYVDSAGHVQEFDKGCLTARMMSRIVSCQSSGSE